MPEAQFVVVLTTFPVEGDADSFARTLVEEHLAACINVLPAMTSIYRWKGAVERADERQVIIKTKVATVAALAKRLGELHPHDVPEFLVINIEAGSPAYLSWLADSVR